MHTRTSQAVPVVPETSVVRLPGSASEPVRQVEPSPNRRAVIEPGVGCFRIVYRDEHGYPMLDWLCDPRVSDEDRQWMRKIQQAVGDKLPGVTVRLSAFPLPRLVP